MTIQEAAGTLTENLVTLYDRREASGIADMVLENLTGWRKADRIIHKATELTAGQAETLKKYTSELLTHKPVQYVLQQAWFCGIKFHVDDRVLIPRPETEELVSWLAEQAEAGPREAPETREMSILDVGTGSGCIAISLKRKLPAATIYACDVSEGALQVAVNNATDLQTAVSFLHLDFLDPDQRTKLPLVDYIVSNPPYIPAHEKAGLPSNVVGYEPHLALFVPDGHPLLFYEALADFACFRNKHPVFVFAELHEEMARQAQRLFIAKGFEEVEIKKDIHGKERMIRACTGRWKDRSPSPGS